MHEHAVPPCRPSPDQFAAYWNASQAGGGAGSRWPPTRRTCWARSSGARRGSRCSSRPPTPAARSSRRPGGAARGGSASAGSPRSSTFEENVRFFPAPLPVTDEEDPLAVLERGDTRRCGLRLHNGTIYRWNRPVYDIAAASRTCASRTGGSWQPGPTMADTLANAAFYFGLVRSLAESQRPCGRRCRSSAAGELHTASRQGIEAQVYWPGVGQVRATRSWSCVGSCRWPARDWSPGGVGRRDRPLPRDHRAAVPDRRQRCRVVRAPDATAVTSSGGRPACDAARLPRADAHQRTRAHLGLVVAAGSSSGGGRAPGACLAKAAERRHTRRLRATPTQRGACPVQDARRTSGGDHFSAAQPLPGPPHPAAGVPPAVPVTTTIASGVPPRPHAGRPRPARRRRRPVARLVRRG